MRKNAVLLCLLVALAACLPYLPSLDNGFTNWDDREYVVDNPAIRDLSAGGVRHLFSSFAMGNYHPLTMLSYALDYRLFGLEPGGYHAVNLALHVLNALLALWIVLLLSGDLAAAAVAALLFAVHPLHVEPVAWVSGRKDVLSTLFFFAAFVAYLRRPAAPRGGAPPWACVGLFSLSLLAKPMGVTFPLVLLLADRLRGRKLDRAALLEKTPIFLLSALFAVLAFVAQRSSGAMRPARHFPWWDNLLAAAHGLLFYLGKLFAPVHLSALYPFPPAGAGLPLSFLVSPLPAAALLGLFLWRAGKSRPLAFGGLFFLATLLPVLQLVRIGNAFAADRYLYLPSLGLFYLAGIGFSRLAGAGGGWPLRRVGACVAAALVLGSFSWLSRQRTLVWRDSVSLWSDVVRGYPDSGIAHQNRGDAHAERGDYRQALADYGRALALVPDSWQTHMSIGNALVAQQRPGEAIEPYSRALAFNPGSAAVRATLAFALSATGRLEEAVRLNREAVGIDPGFLEAHFNLGLDLIELGRPGEAVAPLQTVLRLAPGHAQAREALQRALAQTGR